ncbi:hypothetical protein OF83DRAFT_273939 [Amylostereum chailletii]|nr:hypothetical protein OF83DRAFT_273939 [Amylostereum chailletii]
MAVDETDDLRSSSSSLLRSQHDLSDVLAPIKLPCGATLPNRLVKAALCEHLASLFGGPPNPSHLALYSRWASGSWGIIISGNVQVSPRHLTLGRDIVLPPTLNERALQPFTQLAQAIHGFYSQHRTLAIMQLSHAGRQSPLLLGGRLPFVPASAPSPIPLGRQSHNEGWLARSFYRLMFQTPRQMSPEDIETTIEDFMRGATAALASGFDGVELHASHGCMLFRFGLFSSLT